MTRRGLFGCRQGQGLHKGKEYGPEEAAHMAAKRADALLDIADVEGQQVWKAVLRAVDEIMRTTRQAGEPVN